MISIAVCEATCFYNASNNLTVIIETTSGFRWLRINILRVYDTKFTIVIMKDLPFDHRVATRLSFTDKFRVKFQQDILKNTL